MAPVLDGFAALRGIGARPDAFPDLPPDEVARTAAKFVLRQMKASTSRLGSFRKINEAIGRESLEAIIGNISERELDALLRGLDKNFSAKTNLSSKRAHLVALAGGTAEPAPDYKAAKRKLTGKAVNLRTVRDLCASFDEVQFEAVLEMLSDAQTNTLIKKIDKNNPRLGTASASWLRRHAMALAAGMAEPQEPEKAGDGASSPWSEAIDAALRRDE